MSEESSPQHDGHAEEEPSELQRTGSTVIAAVFFVVGLCGAAAFATIYGLGEEQLHGLYNQALGLSFMTALLGIGAGLVAWAHGLMPGISPEPRPFAQADAAKRDRMLATLREQTGAIGRRSLLGRLLFAALGVTGLAALFPLRSLGSNPTHERKEGGWHRGERVVREDGRPVRVEEMEFGSILTVFPENRVRDPHSQTVLLRVPPGLLRLEEPRKEWAPEGFVAYSKVCTHNGCPVGLYQVESQRLFCPCHQSAFDVLRGAQPQFGPATRPLPQLPLEIDAEGHLVARGDFSEPPGPGFWTLPS